MKADSIYDYFPDADHGWVKVPMSDLRELNVEGVISPYSYISHDRQFAYLEHSSDAARFDEQFRHRFGHCFSTRKFDEVWFSFIRFLPAFPAVNDKRFGDHRFVACCEEEACLLAKLVAFAHCQTDSRSGTEEVAK